MDIWGVDGVEAEAELLSAIVKSFQSMGITEHDVGIKVIMQLFSCLNNINSYLVLFTLL